MIKKYTENVIEHIFERVRLKFKNITDEELYSTIWKKVKGTSHHKLYEGIDNIDDFECQCELCKSQDDDNRFGVTVHLMNEKVDSGKILSTKSFPITKKDNLFSLLNRTHNNLFKLFIEFVIESSPISSFIVFEISSLLIFKISTFSFFISFSLISSSSA